MTPGDRGGTGFPAPRPTMIRRIAIALAAAAIVAVALAPTARASKLEYGIVPQDGALPTASDLDMMPGGGIEGLRMMIPWGVVEPTQGEYDWSQVDPVIREITKREIKPYPFLYGSPVWAAEKDGWPCSGNECAVYPPRTDETQDAFAAFAAAAAARYGPGGDFWRAPLSSSLQQTATGEDDPGDTTDCPLPISALPAASTSTAAAGCRPCRRTNRRATAPCPARS